VDRKRVQAMAKARQEEKDRQAAEERDAITDWKAEIERQAEEWRAEFLRKKEEAEIEEMMAVQQTLEYLIEQTMLANKELPEREIPKKQKSAYQIEWEKLQAEDASTTGNNTDADDVVHPDSDRRVEEELNAIEDEVGNSNEEAVKEANAVVTAIVRAIFFGAFEVIDKKARGKYVDRMKVEEEEIRRETSAVINGLVARIQVQSDKDNIIKIDEAMVSNDEQTQPSPTSPVNTEERAGAVVTALMAEMITLLETTTSPTAVAVQEKETTAKMTAEESDKLPALAPAVVPETKTEEVSNAAADVHKLEEESAEFRASLPRVEVDAVAGFFEEKRAAVKVLRNEKAHLKSVIARYKKKFEKQYGHEPAWNERTKEIKMTYEDYQEVG
jgi:hypothetical protein